MGPPEASSWLGWVADKASWGLTRLATASLAAPWAATRSIDASLNPPAREHQRVCCRCACTLGDCSLDGTDSCMTVTPTSSLDPSSSTHSSGITTPALTCSKCGAALEPMQLQDHTHLLSAAANAAAAATCPDAQPSASLSTWLQAKGTGHPTGVAHLLLRATRNLVVTGGKVAVASLVMQTALPNTLLRGSTLPGTAVRAWAALCLGRIIRNRRAGSDPLRGSSGLAGQATSHSSALAVLGLPASAWLNDDAAARLLVQARGDVKRARERAAFTDTWRRECGIDVLFAAPSPDTQQPPATSTKSGSWWSHRWNSRQSSHTYTQEPHRLCNEATAAAAQVDTRLVPAAALQHSPAFQAAMRVRIMTQLVATWLVHLDDARGLAIMWSDWGQLHRVRPGVTQLLASSPGAPRSTAGSSTGSGKGSDTDWLQAVAMQAALMADWVWRVRLPGCPVEAGRSVQVLDLKGVRVSSALVDTLAMTRALTSAGHHYPQRLYAMLVLNPPPSIGLCWRMVSPLLPRPVAEKVHMIKGSPAAIHAALRQYLPDALIPQQYGGTCTWGVGEHPAHQQFLTAVAADVARLSGGAVQ